VHVEDALVPRLTLVRIWFFRQAWKQSTEKVLLKKHLGRATRNICRKNMELRSVYTKHDFCAVRPNLFRMTQNERLPCICCGRHKFGRATQ
jgi:hypothetical protein